jgi:fructose-bisphosphate aldolase, class II
MVAGAVALAEFTQVIAQRYPITVALHTDHSPNDKLDGYVRPLLAISQQRVDAAINDKLYTCDCRGIHQPSA